MPNLETEWEEMHLGLFEFWSPESEHVWKNIPEKDFDTINTICNTDECDALPWGIRDKETRRQAYICTESLGPEKFRRKGSQDENVCFVFVGAAGIKVCMCLYIDLRGLWRLFSLFFIYWDSIAHCTWSLLVGLYGLAKRRPQRSSCIPQHPDCKCALPQLAFYVGVRDRIKVFVLNNNHFT